MSKSNNLAVDEVFENQDEFENDPHVCDVEGQHVADVAEYKNFDDPDEIREFPCGRLELNQVGEFTIGRGIFEPGWKWSDHVKPIANTDSCLAPHLQYHVKGIMHVVMDDGTEFDCKPGDISWLPEGHDAWTVGDEAVEVIDFHGMLEYAQSKQKQAEVNLKRLIEESPLPMIVYDTEMHGHPVATNQRFEETLGYKTDELTGIENLLEQLFPAPDYRQATMKKWEELTLSSAETCEAVAPLEIEATCSQGQQCFFEVHLTKSESQTIAVFVDSSAQMKIQQDLSYAANNDELTGILNRRGYEKQISRMHETSVSSGTSLSLIILDIDFFKQYNDHYGHAEGDACLRQVAGALHQQAEKFNGVVARYGGEEFAIILSNLSSQDSELAAESFRSCVELLAIPHAESSVSSVVTISAGLVSFNSEQEMVTPSKLLKLADANLYRAKNQGRNRFIAS